MGVKEAYEQIEELMNEAEAFLDVSADMNRNFRNYQEGVFDTAGDILSILEEECPEILNKNISTIFSVTVNHESGETTSNFNDTTDVDGNLRAALTAVTRLMRQFGVARGLVRAFIDVTWDDLDRKKE